LWLPLVTVLNKLFLIIEKLLMEICGVLKVRSLNDSINRASLLAKAAENALSHVDIVLCGTAGAIRTWF
jgi:hypothetical protein